MENFFGNHGIMAEFYEDDGSDSDIGVPSSSDEASDDSINSCSTDTREDASSSSESLQSSPTENQNINSGSLYEISSLVEHLPFKRGLSKHFQGKSQSFTSLANVRCIEDLAKPENPSYKKLKYCRSYGGLLDTQVTRSIKTGSKQASKKASSKSSFSPTKRSGFLSHKPPLHPHKSCNNLANHTSLFA